MRRKQGRPGGERFRNVGNETNEANPGQIKVEFGMRSWTHQRRFEGYGVIHDHTDHNYRLKVNT
jgi:hypothetical protein